jgi:hypothetical protein
VNETDKWATPPTATNACVDPLNSSSPVWTPYEPAVPFLLATDPGGSSAAGAGSTFREIIGGNGGSCASPSWTPYDVHKPHHATMRNGAGAAVDVGAGTIQAITARSKGKKSSGDDGMKTKRALKLERSDGAMSAEQRCGEGRCLNEEVTAVDAVSMVVKESDIDGKGVFAVYEIQPRTVIGYFGGVMICAMCVKDFKLNLKNAFLVIECDVDYTDGDDVFWYLKRSGDSTIDGSIWFTNSSNANSRVAWQREPNVVFQSDGFDEQRRPVICAVSLRRIAAGEELLADYFRC